MKIKMLRTCRDEEFENRVVWLEGEVFEVDENTTNAFYVVTVHDGLPYAVDKSLKDKFFTIVEE